MQRLFASRRGVMLYLAVCLMLGAALGGSLLMSGMAAAPNAMLFAIPVTVLFAVGADFSAYYVCRAYPLAERAPLQILLGLGGAAIVAALLWSALVRGWDALCLATGWPWAGVGITPYLSVLIFSFGLLLYATLAALHYLVVEFMRSRGAQRREMESRLMAQDAELRMLRTQIDPHFLFNSLNSISALTSQNPQGARQMTLELASFFRQSLGMEAHRKVTLEQELRLVRHFLAIEQVRFGARLRVEEQVEPEALACLVPPMLIQPLVENAVKHGIAQLPDGGLLRVHVRRAASVLQIAIDNDVDTDAPPAREGAGIGLANVRQRLACAYGHEASIHCTRHADRYTVAIAMPAEQE